MKIVIKGNQKVKMYSGNINYEDIKTFINTNFSSIKDWTISFEDQEGDAIMITSDIDLEVMKEMFPGREFIKINIESSSVEQKQQQEPQEEKIEKVEEPEEKVQEKRSDSSSQEKSKGKRKHKKCKKFNKIEKLASQHINKIVEEKIKVMMPCIVNQVQVSGKDQVMISEGTVHVGIICTGCNMNPITGIRYKCLQCSEFNLCQICEEKVTHEHDLLKMKVVRAEQKTDSGKLMRKFMKFSRKMMKKQHRSSSSSDSSPSKDKSPRKNKMRKHKKDRKERKQKLSDQNKKERIYKRRANKMTKVFGGQASDYENFIDQTFQKPMKDILTQYAQENNINYIEDRENKRKMNKMRKLALYFNAKEEDFKDIVNAHPESKFKELLAIVKETGMYDCEVNDEVKISNVESRFRWQKKGQRTWQREVKKSKLLEKVEEKQEKKDEQKTEMPMTVVEEPVKVEKDKNEIIREKGKIFIEMKELFGEDKSKELFKFIEENFELGQEKIVEKWIVQEFEKSQK